MLEQFRPHKPNTIDVAQLRNFLVPHCINSEAFEIAAFINSKEAEPALAEALSHLTGTTDDPEDSLLRASLLVTSNSSVRSKPFAETLVGNLTAILNQRRDLAEHRAVSPTIIPPELAIEKNLVRNIGALTATTQRMWLLSSALGEIIGCEFERKRASELQKQDSDDDSLGVISFFKSLDVAREFTRILAGFESFSDGSPPRLIKTGYASVGVGLFIPAVHIEHGLFISPKQVLAVKGAFSNLARESNANTMRVIAFSPNPKDEPNRGMQDFTQRHQAWIMFSGFIEGYAKDTDICKVCVPFNYQNSTVRLAYREEELAKEVAAIIHGTMRASKIDRTHPIPTVDHRRDSRYHVQVDGNMLRNHLFLLTLQANPEIGKRLHQIFTLDAEQY